jgi:phage terminase large subunit-like protein
MLIDDALARNDPQSVIRLYTASPSLDPFSDEAIRQANPAFGDFQNSEEVRSMARNAKRMPASEASYRNLVLNQRVSADKRFVPQMVWEACGTPPAAFDRDTPLYLGLDLSAATDLTACVQIGKVDDIWQVQPTFWLPDDGLRDRAATDRVPYDLWAQQGFLETMPGRSVDYEYVARWLRELFDEHNVIKVGFDRWRFDVLKAALLRNGFEEDQVKSHFVEFGQGYQSMSPALDELSKALVNTRIAHGNHPVLAMCANNAVVQSDPAGNRKLNKAKSVRRIDGMVALAMAFGVAHLEAEEKPTYELFVIA